MPTYYVEDYDGERNEDAVEPVVLNPVSTVDDPRQVESKVVEPKNAPAPKATRAKAETKQR